MWFYVTPLRNSGVWVAEQYRVEQHGWLKSFDRSWWAMRKGVRRVTFRVGPGECDRVLLPELDMATIKRVEPGCYIVDGQEFIPRGKGGYEARQEWWCVQAEGPPVAPKRRA